MTRTIFAVAVAGLLTIAVSGPSQAAPIAPLSATVTATDQSNVTPVYWYHRGWYGHRRHCWRGRWGHLHCRWW